MSSVSPLPVLAGLLLTGCLVPGPGSDEPAVPFESGRREIVGHVGQRMLDEDWAPNEDQLALGFDVAWLPPDGWIELETGLHYSWDDTDVDVGGTVFDADGEILEFFVGVKKSVLVEPLGLRPYVGLGGSFVLAGFEGDVGGIFVSDQEVALGGYAKAGLLIRVTADTFVGVEVRGLSAQDVQIAGVDVPVESLQVTLAFSGFF